MYLFLNTLVYYFNEAAQIGGKCKDKMGKTMPGQN
jgi:hypothetical protein